MSLKNYPFSPEQTYRFDFRGQGKSVATTGDWSEVHVIQTVSLSDHQLWIAKISTEGEVRFLNVATNAYLEKNEGNDDLTAANKSVEPGKQVFEARPSITGGWVLFLFKDKSPWPVDVNYEDDKQWLRLAKFPFSIFDIIPIGAKY